MLSAVQNFNNPLTTFKTESFIVLSIIAWTYLMHAHYRNKNIDYRYLNESGQKRKYKINSDRSYKYWDLFTSLEFEKCPLDKDTINNLKFLIGLRNHIEHHRPVGLDSYLSARYQACALNFNHYIKLLHGQKYGLDNHLALSIQFAELDYTQANIIKDKEMLIPSNVKTYIAEFDNKLTSEQISSDRYSYKLMFTKITANRTGQADRVIEFIDPNSPLAKNISKELWVKKETEKMKFRVKDVVKKVQEAGFNDFGIYQHTQFWKKYGAKDSNKGFGTLVTEAGYWFWYENWIDFIIKDLNKGRLGL